MSEIITYKIDSLPDAEGMFIKAIMNREIIATLMAEIQESDLYLASVNVNRSYRRQGIASCMINILKGRYPKRKIKGILLPQDPFLTSQQLAEFYSKNGFKSDGVYRGTIEG